MKHAWLLLICALTAGQGFDAKMPAGVPAVEGTLVTGPALRYIEVQTGQSEPALAGQAYTVHYTGWLRDGTKFDSSRDRNEPFEFVQGRRQVISGWDIGFEGMKVGGRRRMFLPYQLAYGERANGAIPAKAELIFDVELLGVKVAPELKAAVDVLLPLEGARAKVLALARAVPDDKWGWRPAPAVRTFGQVFLHIALGNQLLLNMASESPSKEDLAKIIAANESREKQAVSKAETVRMLEEGFAAIKKAMEASRAGMLGRETDFFGSATTRRGIYVVLDTHVAEHLGQAIAYARMNGITPPWSAGQ